jgi:imidazolonepropionase-like amidohydrolase
MARPDTTVSEAVLEAARRQWREVLAMFRPLVQAGAKFVTGSDVPVLPLVPGFSIHWELEQLVTMGLTPGKALQAGTRNAAEAAGKLSESGTVEVGKAADLMLLDADPLANISNTRQIRAVVTRGRVLDRTTLDRMLDEAEAFANPKQ